jgi:plastocyanin
MKLLTIVCCVLSTYGLASASELHDGTCCAVNASAPGPTHYIVNAHPAPQGDVTGKATGKILLDGEKPVLEPLDIVAEKAVGCVPEGQQVEKTDQSIVVGEGNALANAVITIAVKGAEVKVPPAPISIDQKGCRFSPHVLAVPAGATVEFLNSDKVSHNVHTYPTKNTAMNKTIAAGSKEAQVLEKADRIEIKCDIHPWMNSWLLVTDTPFMAVTGPDGAFSIEGLAPGKYDAEVWHEKLGKEKVAIEIAADGSSKPVEVKMKAGKSSSRSRR